MDKTPRQYGFSLAELMIVIVIIAVLAAIAVPTYYKNVEHAKRAEALAGIGSVRTQLLVAYGVDGRFPISPTYQKVVGRGWNDIQPGELDGRYFQDKNYKYRSFDGVEYRIRCSKAGVMEKNVWLDETGHWKFDDTDDD